MHFLHFGWFSYLFVSFHHFRSTYSSNIWATTLGSDAAHVNRNRNEPYRQYDAISSLVQLGSLISVKTIFKNESVSFSSIASSYHEVTKTAWDLWKPIRYGWFLFQIKFKGCNILFRGAVQMGGIEEKVYTLLCHVGLLMLTQFIRSNFMYEDFLKFPENSDAKWKKWEWKKCKNVILVNDNALNLSWNLIVEFNHQSFRISILNSKSREFLM